MLLGTDGGLAIAGGVNGGLEAFGGGLASGAVGGDAAGTVGVHGMCTGGRQVGGFTPASLGGVAPALGSAGSGGLAADGGVAPVLLGGRNVLVGAWPASGMKGPNRRGA